MDRTSLLASAIQTAGLRLTPQRQAICQFLAESSHHPTAQEIFNQIHPQHPSLSLATVYNTLETLVRLGVVNELGSVGDDSIHYDADTRPHVNLACVSCHRVIDLPSQYVQALGDEVSNEYGYQILGARVLYYGLCPECRLKN